MRFCMALTPSPVVAPGTATAVLLWLWLCVLGWVGRVAVMKKSKEDTQYGAGIKNKPATGTLVDSAKCETPAHPSPPLGWQIDTLKINV